MGRKLDDETQMELSDWMVLNVVNKRKERQTKGWMERWSLLKTRLELCTNSGTAVPLTEADEVMKPTAEEMHNCPSNQNT